jgi:peptidoglycan/LPS O-acetylase OafA/YrhL
MRGLVAGKADVAMATTQVGSRQSKILSNPEAAKINSYPLFDWLRFILASVVVLGHAQVIEWSQAGNLSVQVFFALSGYLIGGILLETKREELPRFFFNRTTRIWIPYFFAILALYTVSLLRDPVSLRWFEFLFYDVTFTHNWFSLKPNVPIALAEMPLKGTNNHFWSIAVEEQFYLASPLIVSTFRFGRSPLFWGAVVLLLLGLHNEFHDFASISLGVLTATLKRRFGDWHLRPVAIVILSVVAIVSFALLMNVSYYCLGAPIFATAIVLCAARPGHREPLGMFAGGISYPFYLNHWMGGFVAHGLAKRVNFFPHFAEGFLAYAGGLAAGVAAYVLVDRVVMRSRNAYYSQALGLSLGITAYLLVGCGLVVGTIRWMPNLP